MQAAIVPASLEQLLVRLCVPACTINLSGRLLTQRMRRYEVASADLAVWRTAARGCTVKQGGVTLPAGDVWLLTGSGCDFEGVTFKGAPPLALWHMHAAARTSCATSGGAIFANSSVSFRESTSR